METVEKLSILAAGARYDASCASSGSERRGSSLGATSRAGVCHAWTEDGRCVSLLKVLLSNVCRFDCAYCANRVSADIERCSLSPDELIRIVLSFYRRNYIEGLFLSSGVFADPDQVMDRMIEVARRLRQEEGFGGYIHLKAIPGAGERTLKAAGQWADRLSANIELPTERALQALAPDKDGRAIVGMMRSIDARIREGEDEGRTHPACRPRARARAAPAPWAPAGQSTQLVVGASPDSDRDIVRLAGALYKTVRLRRVYYSAYLPVSHDPRLPASSPPLLREHRLYQADWLVRRYGFSTEDILEDDEAQLARDVDPKTAWALRHLDRFPLELMSASKEEILRVPGIGTVGTQRILAARRSGELSARNLPRLGIVMKRARWFVLVSGKAPEGVRGIPEPGILRRLVADRPDLALNAAEAAAPAYAAPPYAAAPPFQDGLQTELDFGAAATVAS